MAVPQQPFDGKWFTTDKYTLHSYLSIQSASTSGTSPRESANGWNRYEYPYTVEVTQLSSTIQKVLTFVEVSMMMICSAKSKCSLSTIWKSSPGNYWLNIKLSHSTNHFRGTSQIHAIIIMCKNGRACFAHYCQYNML